MRGVQWGRAVAETREWRGGRAVCSWHQSGSSRRTHARFTLTHLHTCTYKQTNPTQTPPTNSYIHDYHVTWVKDGADGAADCAAPDAASAAASAAAAASAGAGGAAAPADPVTQALLALYFFLAGLLVRGHPTLWLMPAAFTAYAALHWALASAGAPLFHNGYALLPPAARARWLAAAAHLAHSALAGGAALALALAWPREVLGGAAAAWLPAGFGASSGGAKSAAAAAVSRLPFAAFRSAASTGATAPAAAAAAAALLPADPAAAAAALAAAATGFFAFRLWLLARAPRGSALAVLQYALLLLVYGVVAYKREHVGPLAAALACELAAVPALLRRLRGGSGGGLLLALERAAFVLLRLLPHAALAAAAGAAWARPAGGGKAAFAFASPAYAALAAAGLGVVLVGDLVKLRRLARAPAAPAAAAIKIHGD